MKLHEIIAELESFAPPALQENYDNAGLLVGRAEQEIKGALLCLDVTEQVIDEAIAMNCNLIIAHHPVIFSGIKKLTGSTDAERSIIKAIQNNIAVYAAHTNLDKAGNGVNKKIAEKLSLQNTRVLKSPSGYLRKLYTFVPNNYAEKVRKELFAAGAGVIGNYDECSFNAEGYGTFRAGEATKPFAGAQGLQHREMETKVEVIFPLWKEKQVIRALLQSHPYEEAAYDIVALQNQWNEVGDGLIGSLHDPMNAKDFLKYVSGKMKAACIRHTKLIFDSIQTVAICGGSGSFLLKDAISGGAEVFITGDFKYHQFFDAGDQIIVFDIGHYESEQFTPEIFREVLQRKFPTFALRFSNINTNPVNYFNG